MTLNVLSKIVPEQMIPKESFGYRVDHWLERILSALVTNPTQGFSGLGLILYYAPLSLPVLPMARNIDLLQIPTRNVDESIALLRKICKIESRFHDGYHLVNAQTLQITHVSHYFSPPISDGPHEFLWNQHIGARFMSAWLGSLMPTVCRTAIVSKEEGAIVFAAGEAKVISAAQN